MLPQWKGMTPETVVVDAPITWRGWSPQNYGRSYSGRVTLMNALARSINTIPVRLAKDKLGTDVIAQTAKRMGVETPIRTDKTMPLGTSEVTVLDQATAYAVFPAGGFQSRRHGISQILNYDGDILYDFFATRRRHSGCAGASRPSPDEPHPDADPCYRHRAAAALDNGVITGGKTGTTQAYRDAWFVGFTGDYTTAVWFGNDDYTSTDEMTGGSLPAMTFKRLMDYAEQGIEHRPIPGIEIPPPEKSKEQPAVAAKPDENALPPLVRPRSLSAEVTRLLKKIEDTFENVPPLKAREKTGGKVAVLEAPDEDTAARFRTNTTNN